MHAKRTAAGIPVSRFDTIGSTNAEALARARAGERGPHWILARRQEAGRGRRGRHWVSETGNLYATLLLADPSPPDRAPELSFVAALAVHDAVAEIAPGLASAVLLKWPNDLLLGGKKFSGILIEGEGMPAGPFAVAVGIGVNCAHHPDKGAFPATDLATAGVEVSPDRLFAALAPSMARRLAQWERGAGFATTRADWLARGPRCGETLSVKLDQRAITGRFDALDDAGRLVLRLPNGAIATITAGDVFALGGAGVAENAQP
jgi:BirA family biotin operon repressor/biotin-[acetyl-CoA-carboxylase] ligase